MYRLVLNILIHTIVVMRFSDKNGTAFNDKLHRFLRVPNLSVCFTYHTDKWKFKNMNFILVYLKLRGKKNAA